MDVEAALKILLSEDAGVSALVGNRIFVGVPKQTVTYPAIVLRTRAEVDDYTLEADFTSHAVIRIWSDDTGQPNYANAKAVDRAVRACLRGFSGTVFDSASPPTSLEIQVILRLQCVYQYVDETQTHEWVSDYEIHATEP